MKAFHARKRSTPTSTPEESKENVTLSKVRRMDFPHYPPWTLGQLEEGSSRGIQIGKGQQEGIPRESQKVADRLACGYCGKTNHTEDECWVKGRKCLIYGSSNHQISNYPKKQPRENNAQQVDGTKPKQANERGNRSKVPHRYMP